MKFFFSLQRVLDLKYQLEEQKKIDLKRLTDFKDQVQKHLDALKRNLSMITEEIYSKTTPSPVELVLLSEYREQLLHEIDLKEKEIKALDEKIEEKRREVLDAIKERKKLEKLKERAYIRFLEEEKRIEQKEIDEHASHKKEVF